MEDYAATPALVRKTSSSAGLRFDFGDIFRSARYALSFYQLFTQVVALVPAYTLFLLLSYWSLLLSGNSLRVAWARFGLFPCLFAARQTHSLTASLLFVLGVLILIATFLLASTAGSRLTFMKLRGNYAYSVREAYDFALSKLGVLLLAPSTVAIAAGLFLCGGFVVGLLGRIPYLGELIVTGFAWVWMLAALIVFILFAIAITTFVLTPQIVAATEENAFEAIFQTASIMWSEPWRLLLYSVGVILTAVAGLIVLAFSAKRAFIIMDALFSSAMGADYRNLSTQAQCLLQGWSMPAGNWLHAVAPNLVPYIFFSRTFSPVELSPWFNALAHVFGLALLFSTVWILAYPLSIVNSGLTLSYLILRKCKDDVNLLERYQADESTSP